MKVSSSPQIPRLRSSFGKSNHDDDRLDDSAPLSWFDSKDKKGKSLYFTLGKTVALVAFWSSLAVMLTGLVAIRSLSDSMLVRDMNHEMIPPALPARRNLPLRKGSHLQRLPFRYLVRHRENIDSRAVDKGSRRLVLFPATRRVDQHNKVRPQIAWLMSFPNSGTSFTIHLTREASNCVTATNYALEGEVRDKPSVPVYPGNLGLQGPWLELIPGRKMKVSDVILTKTHCEGFCFGSLCRADRAVQTVRSFLIGCLSGTRAIDSSDGLVQMQVTYNASLVTRAIHLFRHPLDNVVARFRLEYNERMARGDSSFMDAYPNNNTGFQRWCARDDENSFFQNSAFVDKSLKESLGKIPCFKEFFQYVQWHNNAFAVSHEMGLPTLLLHYKEYAHNLDQTRDRILTFLGLPLVGDGVQFHAGKIYPNYYSLEQKRSIRAFLKEFASVETWDQIKDYDFETLGMNSQLVAFPANKTLERSYRAITE